jgi:8-oxo-dGTP diphosphatase
MSFCEMPPKTIHVVAAYIEEANRVLLDRRAKGTHLAGHWEFPGGKIEPGETDQLALARELKEELGVASKIAESCIASVRHKYEEFEVHLRLYAASICGEAQALDVAEIRWFQHSELKKLPMPPADQPLLEAVFEGEWRHDPKTRAP